jgi:DNA-binding transcriptional regulator YhcF (GntR family)
MQWKFAGGQPVYLQIMAQLKTAVLAGEFPSGGRIPPVRELAFQAQVNPNTMQRALVELEQEGLLESRGTLGRFVTDDPTILDAMRDAALESVIRSCASQFKAVGLTMQQAAAMLLALEEEEEHG